MAVGRFWTTNHVQKASAVLSVSAQQTAATSANLKDQQRSKTWRTPVGWTLVAGFNARLDYSEGGTQKNATIAAGPYVTGAALAAAITTAMNAVAVSNTYLVTYSTTTNKFTIARATGSATISLLWSTGTFANASVGKDLGFDVTSDDTGATTYTGDSVSYQSRHYVQIDFGTDIAADNAAVIRQPGVTIPGIWKVHAAASAGAVLATPAFTDTLNADGDFLVRMKYFSATQAYRHWALVIDNTADSSGFTELGIWYLGSYIVTSVNYAQDFTRRRGNLSVVQAADHGATYVDQRPERRQWTLQWLEIASSDLSQLDAVFGLLPTGKDCFFDFAPGTPIDMAYVYFAEDPVIGGVSGGYYNVSATLFEAL